MLAEGSYVHPHDLLGGTSQAAPLPEVRLPKLPTHTGFTPTLAVATLPFPSPPTPNAHPNFYTAPCQSRPIGLNAPRYPPVV